MGARRIRRGLVGHWPRRLGPVDDIWRGCTCTTYIYRDCPHIGPMCVWIKSQRLCHLSRIVGGGGKAAVVQMKSLSGSMNMAIPPLPLFASRLLWKAARMASMENGTANDDGPTVDPNVLAS